MYICVDVSPSCYLYPFSTAHFRCNIEGRVHVGGVSLKIALRIHLEDSRFFCTSQTIQIDQSKYPPFSSNYEDSRKHILGDWRVLKLVG